MNIVNKLTLQHMLLNKRRTLVTMIGIILAVALLAAVPAAVYSVMDFFGRAALEEGGYYHVKFHNYLYGDNDTIIDKLDVKNYVVTKNIGDYAYEFDGSNMKATPYTIDVSKDIDSNILRVVAVTDEYYQMLCTDLDVGNYPSNDREIVISGFIADEGIELGDKLLIGETEYTVSGITRGRLYEDIPKDQHSEMSMPIACIKLNDNILKENDIVNGYFYVHNPGTYIEDIVNELVEELDTDAIPKNQMIGEKDAWYCSTTRSGYNYQVMSHYGISDSGNENAINTVMIGCIAFVIVVAAGAAISNGFSISLSERSQYLGMIASVGATKKQKRGSVYFEGFIEGIIAIPLGLFLGLGGMTVVIEIIEPTIKRLVETEIDLYMVVDKRVVLWTIAFSIILIGISVYLPAKRASLITPIDAIRQNKDVKLTNKTIKTMGVTRKFFGFEGDLALKNLKRNNKRYAITVFSMAVSFILFITVYSMMYYLKGIKSSEQLSVNLDMGVVMYGEKYDGSVSAFEDITEKLIGTGLLEKYHIYAELCNEDEGIWITEKAIVTEDKYFSEDYLKYLKDIYASQRNEYIYPVVMTTDDLKEYLESVDIDYDQFVSDKYNVILFDDFCERIDIGAGSYLYKGNVYSEELKNFDYEIATNKLSEYQNEDGTMNDQWLEVDKKSMEIHIYSREENLMGLGISYGEWEKCVYMLITPELSEELHELGLETYNKTFALNTDEHDKVAKMLEEELEKLSRQLNEYVFYNYVKDVDRAEDMIFLISLFTYGFVILLSLISITSIVNTISTSFALRRREFAMLKSVGMTDKSFFKMIIYESWFYGMKAMFFGIPIGSVFVFAMHYLIKETMFNDIGIPWSGYIIAVAGIFLVIGVTMFYSAIKIKKENVINSLKNENV